MPPVHEQHDVQWMRRAIDLAMRGRGAVEPNPMVGCIIVKDGRIIGEGYHGHWGGLHAEPNAVRACAEPTQGATAYVTLEPCCHTNKKTPPCVPALVAAGLERVVIGCADPNALVDGRGIEQLREAGIEVTTGVCEAEAKQLIAPFFACQLHARPYVTLKWAQTANGKVAGAGGRRIQISNPTATRAVHELRARSDAIMVGINTVLSDDPLLTARDVEQRGERPLRIVLDSNLRMPLSSRLVQTEDADLLVICSRSAWDQQIEARKRLTERIGFVAGVDADGQGRLSLPQVLHLLTRPGKMSFRVMHLLVEPGPTLAAGFLRENLVDRLWVIRSPHALDEPEALNAPDMPGEYVKTGEADLDGDRLTEYINPASGVFFAAVPSADFRLAQASRRQ